MLVELISLDVIKSAIVQDQRLASFCGSVEDGFSSFGLESIVPHLNVVPEKPCDDFFHRNLVGQCTSITRE